MLQPVVRPVLSPVVRSIFDGFVSGPSPSLSLNFVTASTLDSRITFTRASTATFTGSNGQIQTAAINAPRFDYDPTTLAPLGLLIEEQRTNLLTYSEQFDNAAWTKGDSTITANTIVAPDGTLTGDKIIEGSGASLSPRITSGAISATAQTYVVSLYLKAGERRYINVLGRRDATNYNGVLVDLVTGTLSAPTRAATTNNVSTSTITSVGNGWYRVTMAYTYTTTGNTLAYFGLGSDSAGAVPYTGDGVSGIYIWGAQLEVGAFPTSYIPTVASQVTRAADVAVMTGTNFSSWYNASEGALFCEGSREYLAATTGLVQIDDGTNNNRIAFQTTNTAKMRVFIVSGGVTQTTLDSAASLISNVIFKTALGYVTNNVSGALNGVSLATDTSATIPAVSTMRIGQGLTTSGACRIQRIAYYPRRLANSELQAITA
jgi:hypothetical protein